MSTRAVFFDFGGTLFSYRAVQGRAFRPLITEALRRMGVDRTVREVGRHYGRASAQAHNALASQDYYLHKDLFQDTLRRFALEIGAEATAEDLEWFHEAQRQLVIENFELREDCRAVLDALGERGMHRAIVSNIDDDMLLPMVERAGLERHLEAWYSSEGTRSCKPHRGIFDHALERAGVGPDESFFVGDSLEADVAGGNALGFTTVWLREPEAVAPGAGSTPAGEPDHVIENLSELLDLTR